MPRPKRSKVAPSVPVSKRSQPTNPTAPVAKKTQPLTLDVDDIYDASDREYEIATNSRRARNSLGKNAIAKDQARRLDDEVEDNRAPAERASDHEDSPLDLGDFEGGSVQDSPDNPEIERGRRSMAAVDSSTYNIGNFKRRPRQPSILGRANERTRSSSIDSDLAESNGLTSVKKMNTSVLSVANFKRRARQPSIIGRNAARARSSSIGLETDSAPVVPGSAYKIGTFKRRAREPSILQTGQKQRQSRPDFESENDGDDFNPEDESTPLNLSKARNLTEQQGSQSAASSTPGSNSRKRKLSAVQVPQSQSPALLSAEPDGVKEIVPATAEDASDDEEGGSEAPDLPVSSRLTPEVLSETMAPPRSSSLMSSSPELPSISRSAPRGRRILRGRTPPARQESPISSPPSLTHSPNRPVKGRSNPKRQSQPPSTLSTAQLQGLLPRRRRRPAADPFDVISDDDVDASCLASEDDELSHLTVRPQRRPTGLLTRKPAPLKRGPKPKAGTKMLAKRTYGSRTSDKENEDAEVDPDDSLAPVKDHAEHAGSENSQQIEARVGKELKEAARKFQEVDKWELEFEDVTASSSSPREAR